MEVKVSEREDSYCKDILDEDGSIIVTFSSGVKNMWFSSMCVMKEKALRENLNYFSEEYNKFLTEAKEKAINNGLIVF